MDLNTFNLYLFGGTGDLSNRKLIPAMFRQETLGNINNDSEIIGLGSRDISVDDYTSMVQESLIKHFPGFNENDDAWKRFSKRLSYIKIDINSKEDWKNINNIPTNKAVVYYLATPPNLYKQIATCLKENNLIQDNCRVVVEKPIGTDLESAEDINNSLSAGFNETQIYRIDHYLGKEAVQNLLALRFANTIFEKSWSNSAIDHIQITVAEDLGVEDRGGYYDETGALRDMVQNHLLQILCLIAMEPPVSIQSESVRDEKLKVLKSLAPFTEETIALNSVRAQYLDGISKGEPACAYLDENGVDPKNNTETFVALKLEINNWRWSGVPFYLRTGKRMNSKSSEIVVRYKSVPHNIFSKEAALKPDQLVLRIHPDEGIDLKLNTKQPGVSGYDLEELPLDLNLHDYHELGHQDCYERLLLDVIRGNPSLFVRRDEIEASWKWIDNIINLWKSQDVPMEEYISGGWGPSNADLLLKRDFRSWKNGSSKKSK
ncbi:MAG: glucose-6-phosphate dehydrogenase [Proteobacteria bacterium]|nr:glucose-6-phosphate dehydrogenase [Pseudomonadota bacterium]NCW10847.1 glucose-6-phosphate dehydrogenase [Pseudomonadota bacterium]